jgi:FkbM family methyltransferase
VVTVEPDRANFACLLANLVDAQPDIGARFAAFGEAPGVCHVVEVQAGNCGAHRVDPGGAVPVQTIDSLGLEPDCIWLDIEGYELKALKGARETIERCRPVVCVEEKGLSAVYGERPEDLSNWLGQFGYTKRAQIGRDNVFAV